MRYITLFIAVLFLTTPAKGQMQTTPATVQVGTSQFLSPGGASDVYAPGLTLLARGHLGEDATLAFSFERRWAPAADLWGMGMRIGTQEQAERFVLGVEGGIQLRNVQGADGTFGASTLQPSAEAYAGAKVGRFYIGPAVTAMVWDDVSSTIGLRVGVAL